MELNEEVVKKSLDWLDSLVGNSNDSDIALLTYQLLGILYDTCEELTEQVEWRKNQYLSLVESHNRTCDYLNTKEVEMAKLPEENEAWQKQLISTEEQAGKAYYDLACEVEDLRTENENLHASCTELTQSCTKLTEENERLRELGTTKEIEKEIVRRETRADTVRQMQERLIKWWKAQIEVCVNAKEEEIIISAVYQIAKEMLEDTNEEG